MKILHTLTSLGILTCIALQIWTIKQIDCGHRAQASIFPDRPRAAGDSSQKQTARGKYDVVEGTVTHIFTAMRDASRFVAYQVEWNGQQVIVSDSLAGSHLKLGDTIKFMVSNTKIDRPGLQKVDTISFTIM